MKRNVVWPAGAMWLAVLALAFVGAAGPAWSQPPEAAQRIMDGPKYKTAHWGLLAVDLDSGQTLAGFNEDKWFLPASTVKLFTVAAAMEVMGPDYRFRTPVYAGGDIKSDGSLKGDLILKASGDLTMGGRTNKAGRLDFPMPDHGMADEMAVRLVDADPLAGLDSLARQVAKSGIKRVDGEVLVDDRLFESVDQPYKDSPLTPVMINDNLVDIIVKPGDQGGPATVEWRPGGGDLVIENRVSTSGPGEEPVVELKAGDSGVLLLSGSVPVGSEPVVRVYPVADPTQWARVLFIEALERAGVKVMSARDAGNLAELLPDEDAYKSMRKVAEFVSPPLVENCRMILKISHNKHADTLPLLMAAHTGGYTFDQGLNVEGLALRDMGFDTKGVALFDGEGGPLGNAVSPRAVVDLLRKAASRPWFQNYFDCLAVLGVDGTLARAVGPQSPVRGKAHAKTGTMLAMDLLNQRLCLGAKSLAGYMTAKSGRRVALAIYVNSLPADDLSVAAAVGDDLGAICEKLYEAF